MKEERKQQRESKRKKKIMRRSRAGWRGELTNRGMKGVRYEEIEGE